MIDRRAVPRAANSGNGGYCCGLVAAQVEEQVDGLTAQPAAAGHALDRSDPPTRTATVEVYDGDVLVARRPRPPRCCSKPPAAVTRQGCEDRVGDTTGASSHDHIFPTCWVCGPDRAPGDGLRLFPGAVPGAPDNLVAAPWTPREDLDDGSGHVATEQVWAALDCPSFFGLGPDPTDGGARLADGHRALPGPHR